MDSLKQYTDLYDNNEATIRSHSPAVLNDMRASAREALEGARLPARGNEGYEKTSVDDMFAPDFGININRVDIPADVAASFRCDVPNISTLTGVVVNDAFHTTSTLDGKLPRGVDFMSLAEAARLYPDTVARYYGSLAPLTDASVALNTLMVQDGVFVRISRGVHLEKPLQLVNIFSAPTPMLAFRRILVVVEDDAEAQLLVCDHSQNATVQYLSSQVTEVILGRNARFDLYDIEESSALTGRRAQLFARQEAGSNLLVNGTTLSCGTTRNDYHIDLADTGCETMLAGMAIASGRQHVDNFSQVNHLAQRGHSRQLFKYVLDDEATGAFEGGILVTPHGRFTEAYQSNRNLLASGKARMHTKPQLEIYDDDVKCSHGATTGQLDADALFYMRTRGIPEREARTMLMQAFMGDVIDTVRMDSLRDRLHHLVEMRFHGRESFCGNCAAAHKNQ